MKQMTTANLDTILEADFDGLATRQSVPFHDLLNQSGTDTLVLFGAGPLGRMTAARLQKIETPFTLYFCDNNPATPSEVMGIPVLRRDEAVARFGQSAVFVVTIYNSVAVENQLRELGCKYVSSYVPLYRAYAETCMPFCALADGHAIQAHEADIRTVDALWADEESREEFRRQLAWHLSDEYTALPSLHPAAETYFAPDLVRPVAHERYVDCGVFDGGEIKTFLNHWNGQFDGIAAFEPDSKSFAKLESDYASLPADVSAKIKLFPYALSDARETVRFDSAGSVTSSITSEGGEEIQAVTLDETLSDWHPTFIKMDIEGAEPSALRGALNILKNDAPLLAICTYHELAHMWEIPLLIHAANPSYKLYFRRYAQDCWETLCYAVPPGR